MIRPVPPPDPDVLHASARWCAELVEALMEVGLRLGGLSDQVAHDWPDGGEEWAERLTRLRRELDRHAEAATEIGEELARWPADQGPDAGLPPTAAAPAHRSGVRLGDTRAARVDDERGVRIAELTQPSTPS